MCAGKCEQIRLLAFFCGEIFTAFYRGFFLHVKSDDKNNNLLCRLSRQGREEKMMNNTGRVLGFNFYEMWQMPHADESFALIMVKLNKEVPEMMDDTYVESIISQLRQLGSDEVFVDYARKEVDSVRSQISQQALRELSAENLVANHIFRGGCVETGAPCMYSNGPCSCLPGYCPFGRWNELDERFIKRQLAKLRSKEDIARAKEEIRRARILAQQE